VYSGGFSRFSPNSIRSAYFNPIILNRCSESVRPHTNPNAATSGRTRCTGSKSTGGGSARAHSSGIERVPLIAAGREETSYLANDGKSYSQMLCLRANSLPSVRKMVARIIQSFFALLRPRWLLVLNFISEK
jgi:hypothetical protein